MDIIPTTPLKTPGTITTPASLPPRKSRTTGFILLTIGLLLIACFMAMAYWRYFGGSDGPEGLPGTLTLQVMNEWTTATGEIVTGIVAYTPSTSEISNILGPNLKTVRPLTFSTNSDQAIGQRTTNTATELVLVSRITQSVTSVLARGAVGDTIANPILSADGSRVAYILIPSLKGLPENDPTGKPYPVSVTDDPMLRLEPGLSLPDAYMPKLHVAMVGGETLRVAGNLRPLAFAPDRTAVLVEGENGFFIVSITGGTQTAVSGIDHNAFTERTNVQGTWDGKYIAVADNTTGSAELFSFDWNAKRFVSLGKETVAGTNPVLANNGGLLFYNLDARAITAYEIKDEKMVRVGTFPLDLREGIFIRNWMPL